MSKVWYPPGGAQFPVTQNATTVGPQVIQTITASPRLEALAHCGVYEDGGRKLSIYRRSTMDLATLSREVYVRNATGGWDGPRKDHVKYAPPEALFPPGAKVASIEGVACGSLEEMSDEQREAMRQLLRERPPG